MPISKRPQNEALFNDGVLMVCAAVKNRITRTKVDRLRYGEKTVGFNRFFGAKAADINIDRVLRLPRHPELSQDDILIMDGIQYRIVLLQRKDTAPLSYDATIERQIPPKVDEREEQT